MCVFGMQEHLRHFPADGFALTQRSNTFSYHFISPYRMRVNVISEPFLRPEMKPLLRAFQFSALLRIKPSCSGDSIGMVTDSPAANLVMGYLPVPKGRFFSFIIFGIMAFNPLGLNSII